MPAGPPARLTVQCLHPPSTLDDTAWPKVSWLTAQLRALAAEVEELQPAQGPVSLSQSLLAGWERLEREEVAVADRIVARLTPVMSSEGQLPESGRRLEPLEASMTQAEVDAATRMVFIRPHALDPPVPYGTRTQTVVVRTQHFVVLYARDTALEEDPHHVQNHAWERFCVPIPHLHRVRGLPLALLPASRRESHVLCEWRRPITGNGTVFSPPLSPLPPQLRCSPSFADTAGHLLRSRLSSSSRVREAAINDSSTAVPQQ